MKLLRIIGCMIAITMVLVSLGCSEEMKNKNFGPNERWIGTWTDSNHSLLITENGTEIIGIGTPFDPEKDYPFRLYGTISEDGNLLHTVMKDNGTRNFNIAEDYLSFSGTGTIDPINDTEKPFKYEINATRNGTTIEPDNIWSGEWLTKETSIQLIQNGSSITGTAHPILDPEYLEEFEGTISKDGKTVEIAWSFSENVTFSLSDDGLNLIETECGEEEIAKGQICFNLTKNA